MKFQIKLKIVAISFDSNNDIRLFLSKFSKIGIAVEMTIFWITQSPKRVTRINKTISRISSFLLFDTDLKVIFLFIRKLIINVVPVEKIFAIKIFVPKDVKTKRIIKSSTVLIPPITENQKAWLFLSFFSRFFTLKFLDFLR